MKHFLGSLTIGLALLAGVATTPAHAQNAPQPLPAPPAQAAALSGNVQYNPNPPKNAKPIKMKIVNGQRVYTNR